MASPPSPRSRQDDLLRHRGNGGDAESATKEQHGSSARPSPALSAYSYTSSTSSSGSDFDLNSLRLDDLHNSTSSQSMGRTHSKSASERTLYSLLRSSHHPGSGSTTPVPGNVSRASTGKVRQYLQNSALDSEEARIESELDEQEDEVENELDGFDVEDEDEDDMHANGVPAARGWRLDARKAQTSAFQAQVLELFSDKLQIETWSKATANPAVLPLKPDNVHAKRISGAFSNAVFFVSYKQTTKEHVGPKTVLLRIYGSGTEALLSRRAELLILHTLSSLYEIGPHILGTFANGRVETYFDAEPIGKDGVRDLGDRRETIQDDGSLLVRGTEGRAQWVARRMRQLHEVPLDTMRTVLEQGCLRANSDGGSVFGRGIENHLFARSHRPRYPHRASSAAANVAPPLFDASRSMRESPAPMAEDGKEGTDLFSTAVEGAHAEAMAIRGYSPHRNNSVASFDSLATSYNSQDSASMASASNDNLLMSPAFGPTGSASSSYMESVNAARSGRLSGASPSPFIGRQGRTHSLGRGSSIQPYPGMWRRSKRWAREAAKVFAVVDEFCKTSLGQNACRKALEGTVLEGEIPFSPFASFSAPRTSSLELGTTVFSLRNTLLAIAAIDFPRLLVEMDEFKRFIRRWERKNGMSRRVLAHGDTQYSNLLMVKEGASEEDKAGKGMPRDRSRDSSKQEENVQRPRGPEPTENVIKGRGGGSSRRMAPYERLIVIDFEYCSPNPRAYDIANAFHEWRFDYHHPTDSWSPYTFDYPTREERRRWLRAYVEQGRLIRQRGKAPKTSLDHTAISSPSGSVPVPSSTLPPEDLNLPPCVLQADGNNSTTPTKTRPQSSSSSSASSVTSTRKESANEALPNGKHRTTANEAVAGFSPGFGPLSSPAIRASLDGGSSSSPVLAGRSSLAYLEASMDREIERIEREVVTFSPACHANWALWGVTFAKEGVESLLRKAMAQAQNEDNGGEVDVLDDHGDGQEELAPGCAESFDNLRYTLSRIELFRKEIAELGIVVS